MNTLESLVRRVRETEYPVTQLHITAPTDLICQMIDDFEERGQVPDFDDHVVRFGPHLAVWVDDDLPAGTFKIQSLAGCVTQ
jgi:hypothetical protein